MVIPPVSAPDGPTAPRRRRSRRWQRRSWTSVLPRWPVVFELGAVVAIAIAIVLVLYHILMLR
jgi:hypothetical protein